MPSAARVVSSERRWVTPVPEPTPGTYWCVHAQRGCYEFLLHPDDARKWIDRGVILDGEPLKVEKVCDWPYVGRVHVIVHVPERNTNWIDAAAA